MSIFFYKEVDKLKKELLALATMVEEQFDWAVRSVNERNEEVAAKVKERDKKIDERETEVEEECLKVLSLYQPVATDMRFIIAILKINNDLERVGDLSVKIAKHGALLNNWRAKDPPIDISSMAENVRTMMMKSINSLISYDADLALQVCKMDDMVDKSNAEIHEHCISLIKQHAADAPYFLHYISISRDLERVGDHATNIAEDVMYTIKGEIVRHGKLTKQQEENGESA
jgi:phosphate transport system protein